MILLQHSLVWPETKKEEPIYIHTVTERSHCKKVGNKRSTKGKKDKEKDKIFVNFYSNIIALLGTISCLNNSVLFIFHTKPLFTCL